jgi:hypothetical protein
LTATPDSEGVGVMAHNKDRAHQGGSRAREVGRYRQAAEQTLDQLDWCIGYLHRIRKNDIAQVVDRNRSFIRRRIRGDD